MPKKTLKSINKTAILAGWALHYIGGEGQKNCTIQFRCLKNLSKLNLRIVTAKLYIYWRSSI